MNKMNVEIPSKVIFWGGTGQAKVNRYIVEYYGSKLVAVFDETEGLTPPFNDVKLHLGWKGFFDWIKKNKQEKIGFCIAIGNPHGRVRLEFSEKLKAEGLIPCPLIHPATWIAPNVEFGEGVQVMAGAVIQTDVKIGNQCIINTKTSVDHECTISNGSELAPGVTLCGNVTIGSNTWIASGSTVLPRVIIGDDTIIGAGSLVNSNIPSNVIAYGVPAKVIRSNHYTKKR